MEERKPIHFSPRQPPFPDPHELAAERPPQSRRGRGLWVIIALLVIALVFAWWGWSGEEEQVAGVEPEVIRADPRPVKVEPDDPGGMTVEDRDKLVYNRLAGEEEPDTVERLLPPAEEPMPPPQPQLEVDGGQPPPPPAWLEGSSGQPNGQPPGPDEVPDAQPYSSAPGDTSGQSQGVQGAAPTSRPARDDRRPAPQASNAPTAADAARPAEVNTAAVPPSAASSTRSSPSGAGGEVYQVQLAAVSSEERAASAWASYKSKHGDLLGSLGSQVVRADLGAKGVFYRLRAGPILGENNARALCNRLSERGVGCMVVRPGG